MTEIELINYFLQVNPNVIATTSEDGYPHDVIYISHIDNSEIEDWIIERANMFMKIKYLCSLYNNEYPYIPNLEKPMRDIRIILNHSRISGGRLEFRFPKFRHSIEIPIETMINIKDYITNIVYNIRTLENNKIEELTLSLGREIELQERVEEYIKKWWNL